MGYDKPDHKNYVRSKKKSSGKTGLLVAIIAIVICNCRKSKES